MTISRASSMTLGRDDEYATYQDDSCEDVPGHLFEDAAAEAVQKRLIIALDFGTTYSCVSYAIIGEKDPVEYLSIDKIQSVRNFPKDWTMDSGDRMKGEVPTEVMYPLYRYFREKENLDPMEENNEDREHAARGAAAQHGRDDCSAAASSSRHDVADNDDAMLIDEDTDKFSWGYEVHEVWGLPSTHSDQTNMALSRFKLLLDESPTTEGIRTHLRLTLDELQKKRIIKGPVHVIADFLTCLLRHTKSELRDQGLDDSYSIEMVLCVPAIWSQKACRNMHAAMAIAMKSARFNGVDIENNSIENLFIVSEPEAAAAYVLAMDWSIMPGDTFVLLDAGGGTVDANTYEVVEPGGGLHGSSFLNEEFRKLLCGLLKDETYLEQGAETINGIIEKIMINEFEYRCKRTFDYSTAKGFQRFSVSGLRDNAKNNFRRGCIYVPVDRIKTIFLGCLEGITSVMENQIKAAMLKGKRVEKVLLIGGFAGSISLKRFLQERLDGFPTGANYRIKLVRPENTATAVASGAVLRAFNKEQGPQRQAKSSYGILRTEPFGDFPEHKGLKPWYDKLDRLLYVKDTVDWKLKLGDEVTPVWQCPPFLSNHTIPCWPPGPLICKEVLYVSERSTESHYRLGHPKNEGAEKVGEIVVDCSFLRDQGLIQPIEPGTNKYGRKIGIRHYAVSYTMVIRIVDRDLKCYAIYDGQVIQKCRINIASAFRPGVK